MSSTIKSKSAIEQGKIDVKNQKQSSVMKVNDSHRNSTTEAGVGAMSGGAQSDKRKQPSLFRIKPGCVVALRFRTDGNTIDVRRRCLKRSREEIQQTTINFDEYFVQVWVDPLPGRDERLGLVGKRIRCFFQQSQGKSKRVLEGEVIRMVDYSSLTGFQPFKVELLVDKPILEHFAFLSRTDADVDISKLPNENARRNHQLQEKIRGKNKATIEVTLEHPALLGMNSSTREAVRWVILKRVPPKLFQKEISSKSRNKSANVNKSNEKKKSSKETDMAGKGTASNYNNKAAVADRPIKKRNKDSGTKSSSSSATNLVTRFCGDGNDSPDQQISNWRWVASRYYDMSMSSSMDLSCNQVDTASSQYIENIITGGLVGLVLKVSSSTSGNSLAMVTIRRLILPEHTAAGRLPNHGICDVFDSCDDTHYEEDCESAEICVPIEHLVIVDRRPPSRKNTETCEKNVLMLSQSYSIQHDAYMPIDNGDLLKQNENFPIAATGVDRSSPQVCHRCRKLTDDLRICPKSKECILYSPGFGAARWCNNCIRTLTLGTDFEDDFNNGDSNELCDLPCCMGFCECRMCSSYLGSELQEDFCRATKEASKPKSSALNFPSPFHATCSFLQSELTEFWLPDDFLDTAVIPFAHAKAVSRVRPRKMKRILNGKLGRIKKNGEKNQSKAATSITELEKPADAEDYNTFKPTCARVEVAYSMSRQKIRKTTDDNFPPTGRDVIRNIRELIDKSSRSKIINAEKESERISSGRAARANQRRLMKDVASFGGAAASTFGLLDSLASREAQLRFDRSSIHAWGVFADEDISADEMIVEYRGELIENAMAEKREKEYETAKIGSDYMFRVDTEVVCDATKQGNVARFINASCDPNCYTKIIPVDGTKRIVIYAKRDINAGEELCYDYKFSLEYDEKKRIPCHCGARDCRGFMNWDKRYVAITEPKGDISSAPPFERNGL